MAFDYEAIKSAAIGLGAAGSIALNGWLAFGRNWTKTRASNANDIQQIDMLERQEKNIERLEKENQRLRDENREYWKTISDTQARLMIIESSQKHLEEQNESLKQQVAELTQSNMNLVTQISKLRTSLEVPR